MLKKSELLIELLTTDKCRRLTYSFIYEIDKMHVNRIKIYKKAGPPVFQIFSPFFTEGLIWKQYSNMQCLNAMKDNNT